VCNCRFGARYPGAACFFEVDLPHASAKKQQLVQQLLQPEASHPRPVFIAADLSRVSLDQALLEPSYAASSKPGASSIYTMCSVQQLLHQFDLGICPSHRLQLFLTPDAHSCGLLMPCSMQSQHKSRITKLTKVTVM
jgi:hypothetical protein